MLGTSSSTLVHLCFCAFGYSLSLANTVRNYLSHLIVPSILDATPSRLPEDTFQFDVFLSCLAHSPMQDSTQDDPVSCYETFLRTWSTVIALLPSSSSSHPSCHWFLSCTTVPSEMHRSKRHSSNHHLMVRHLVPKADSLCPTKLTTYVSNDHSVIRLWSIRELLFLLSIKKSKTWTSTITSRSGWPNSTASSDMHRVQVSSSSLTTFRHT